VRVGRKTLAMTSGAGDGASSWMPTGDRSSAVSLGVGDFYITAAVMLSRIGRMLVPALMKVQAGSSCNSTVSLHDGAHLFIFDLGVGAYRDESASRLELYERMANVLDIGSIGERWIHDNPVSLASRPSPSGNFFLQYVLARRSLSTLSGIRSGAPLPPY